MLWQLESARIDESAPCPLSSGRQHAQIRVSFHVREEFANEGQNHCSFILTAGMIIDSDRLKC